MAPEESPNWKTQFLDVLNNAPLDLTRPLNLLLSENVSKF